MYDEDGYDGRNKYSDASWQIGVLGDTRMSDGSQPGYQYGPDYEANYDAIHNCIRHYYLDNCKETMFWNGKMGEGDPITRSTTTTTSSSQAT